MSAPHRPRETLGDMQAEAPPRGSPQVPESLATFESKFCHSPGPRGAGPPGLLLAPPPALCPHLGPPHPALCLLPLPATHFPAASRASSSSALWRLWAGHGGKDAGVRSPRRPARSEPGALPHPQRPSPTPAENTRGFCGGPAWVLSLPTARGPIPWGRPGHPASPQGTGLGSPEALVLVSLLRSDFCIHTVKLVVPAQSRCGARLVPAKQRAPAPCSLLWVCLPCALHALPMLWGRAVWGQELWMEQHPAILPSCSRAGGTAPSTKAAASPGPGHPRELGRPHWVLLRVWPTGSPQLQN